MRFVVALTDQSEFPPAEHDAITHSASNQDRLPVLVSALGASGQLSWSEFTAIMGGAVPSWRALTDQFHEQLLKAARNEVPQGIAIEAWELLESLVADGLEFCFGRRANRLGGNRRGQRVSDIVAPLPDFNVLVVDAKASADGFDAGATSLRPLVEYVQKQKVRQQGGQGGGDVLAALVVSSDFVQSEVNLNLAAREFLGETRIPLCFIAARCLSWTIKKLRETPDIRNRIQWKKVFAGGLIQEKFIDSEIRAISAERCDSRDI